MDNGANRQVLVAAIGVHMAAAQTTQHQPSMAKRAFESIDKMGKEAKERPNASKEQMEHLAHQNAQIQKLLSALGPTPPALEEAPAEKTPGQTSGDLRQEAGRESSRA